MSKDNTNSAYGEIIYYPQKTIYMDYDSHGNLIYYADAKGNLIDNTPNRDYSVYLPSVAWKLITREINTIVNEKDIVLYFKTKKR